MVAALTPTLPVVLVNAEGESTTASSPREYWQAIYEGFSVSGPVPPPPRSAVPAHLSDVDKALKWQPNTAYTTGAPAINPTGDLMVAKTSFTSGATYDATKWQLPPALSTTYARAGRKAIAVYDEFSRYSNGTLAGQSPLTGAAWQTTGAQGVTVTSGKAASSGTGYAWQTLAAAIGGAACEVSFTGPTANRPMTMAFTLGTSIDLNNLGVHFNFGAKDFSLTVRKDGGTFDTILAGKWRKECVSDGTATHRFGVHRRGDTVVVIGPNGETYSATDPRVSSLTGSVVFWEPNTVSGTAAQMVTTTAYSRAATGQPGQPDLFDFLAGAGHIMGLDQNLAGSRNTMSEVLVGYDPTQGMPAVTFGATTIYTKLTSAASSGATSLVTEHAIPNGSTVLIDSGTGSESVTTNASPTGTGPFTSALATGTAAAHAAETPVIVTVPSSRRTTMYFNTSNQFFFLPALAVVCLPNGNLYLGSALDTFITRHTANVAGTAIDDCWRTGKAATGSRPSASAVGSGSQFFDTTLNKPIWSDGSAWRDASGTAV